MIINVIVAFLKSCSFMQIGFKLADHTQNGERWTLLTKNNFGHSTITVNDAWFLVNGQANITDFKDVGFLS